MIFVFFEARSSYNREFQMLPIFVGAALIEKKMNSVLRNLLRMFHFPMPSAESALYNFK